MTYNFKSIADVEVVTEPTESANVLIEENGIIKKAPKSAVGGGSGEELFITFDSYNDDTIAATEDLYNKIVEMYETGHFRNITLYQHNEHEDTVYTYTMRRIDKYDDEDGKRFLLECGSYAAWVHSNGNIQVEYYD